jgi:hypothetical protein
MDGTRFDNLARSLAMSGTRRRLLVGFAAGALGIVGFGTTDAAVCRTAGRSCGKDAHCCSGNCTKDASGRRCCACPPPTAECHGLCVETATAYLSDPKNCGACGHRCPRTRCEVATCRGGICGLAPDPAAVDLSCNDGDKCTVNDVCQADGTCVGTPVGCPDQDQCHQGYCDPADGQCKQRSLTGTPCDDGDNCTASDTCQNGTCVGTSVVCTDLDD